MDDFDVANACLSDRLAQETCPQKSRSFDMGLPKDRNEIIKYCDDLFE
jgi:hypothetical protein